MTEDLDSLFFEENGNDVACGDLTVLNELIVEHMVLDDPSRLTEVI